MFEKSLAARVRLCVLISFFFLSKRKPGFALHHMHGPLKAKYGHEEVPMVREVWAEGPRWTMLRHVPMKWRRPGSLGNGYWHFIEALLGHVGGG